MSVTAPVPHYLSVSDLWETYRPHRNPPHRHLESHHKSVIFCCCFTCTEITQTNLQTRIYKWISPQMKWGSIQGPRCLSHGITAWTLVCFSSTHLGRFDRSVSTEPALSTSTPGASEELPPTDGTHPLPSLQGAYTCSCTLASNFEDSLVMPGVVVGAESHHKPHATLGNFLQCKALACSLSIKWD